MTDRLRCFIQLQALGAEVFAGRKMSVRLLTVRLIKHGRYILRSYCKRDIHANILDQNQLKTRSKRGFPLPSTAANVLRVSQAKRMIKARPINPHPISSPDNAPAGGQIGGQCSAPHHQLPVGIAV